MQLWTGIEDSSRVSGPGDVDVELRAAVLACVIQAALDVELGTCSASDSNFSECLDVRHVRQISLHLLSAWPLPRGEAEAGRTTVRPAQG